MVLMITRLEVSRRSECWICRAILSLKPIRRTRRVQIRTSTTPAASLSLRPLDEHKMVVVKRNKAQNWQREAELVT